MVVDGLVDALTRQFVVQEVLARLVARWAFFGLPIVSTVASWGLGLVASYFYPVISDLFVNNAIDAEKRAATAVVNEAKEELRAITKQETPNAEALAAASKRYNDSLDALARTVRPDRLRRS